MRMRGEHHRPSYRGRLTTLSKSAEQQGVMVALFPTRDVAEALAQDGGEPVDQMHVTLAYLGRADALDQPERLAPVVAGIAATAPPLTGILAGTGKFTAGPEPVTYATPDVPGLPEMRHRLCEALEGAGFPPSAEHGYTPHMTLAYADIDPKLPNLALAFNELALVIAGERYTFPLTGVRKDAMYPLDIHDPVRWSHDDMSLGRRGVIFDKSADTDGAWIYDVRWEDGTVTKGARQFRLRNVRDLTEDDMAKADFEATWNDGHREVTVPIWKDDAKRIVYGVVMQPGVRDSQGDVVSPEEIEQAAHRFLAESRKHDVQHAEEQVDVVPVESFIAPMDMPFAGRPVLKGSWVMAVHVPDDEIWEQVVKDELTGFSIGGTAERAEEGAS